MNRMAVNGTTIYREPCHLPLAGAAWLLFLGALCLPVIGKIPGWQWVGEQGRFWRGSLHGELVSIHYLALTPANLFMIASPWLIWRCRQAATHSDPGGRGAGARLLEFLTRRRTLQWVAAVAVGLSATYLCHFGRGMGNVKPGFLIWIFSFGLLGVSLWRGGNVLPKDG